jgi:hypothetical protein
MSATLTATEILQDTLEAFKIQFPMLTGNDGFSTDLSPKLAVKDQQIIAHVTQVPSTATYDGTTGFKNGAQNAKDLLVDIPVTMDQLTHVPVKIAYLDAISTYVNKYQQAINAVGYALGKAVVDHALTKVVAANFTHSVTETIANTSRDTLSKATKQLNAQGALPQGRFGIVNSDFFNALDADSRIASDLYHGERRNGDAYGYIQNVAGFKSIWEYPSLPTTAYMTAFFADKRGVVVASRVPDMSQAVASQFGVPQIASFETVTDADSGLSLLGIKWQEPATFDIYMTVAILYGAVAGANGGSANTITDKAGVIVKTQ